MNAITENLRTLTCKTDENSVQIYETLIDVISGYFSTSAPEYTKEEAERETEIAARFAACWNALKHTENPEAWTKGALEIIEHQTKTLKAVLNYLENPYKGHISIVKNSVAQTIEKHNEFKSIQ